MTFHDVMSIESSEEAMLTAFARAASKAQEIEGLLQEMLIAAEVATDTENRSFEEIAAKIEKLPLGPLRKSSWKWRKWLTHCLRKCGKR